MNNSEDLDQTALRSDAKKALWIIGILNFFVVLFYIVDSTFNEFVFIALFIQMLILVLWLIPVFLYKLLVKKVELKLAVYGALTSYKDLISHVSW